MPDAQRSGLYRAPSDIERVRLATDRATRWVELSLRGLTDKGELMRAFAERFELPPTFGANWDALADALQDGAYTGDAGCVLHITDAGMARLPEADRTTLNEVLSRSAEYWRAHGKPFVVLVDGATQLPQWT